MYRNKIISRHTETPRASSYINNYVHISLTLTSLQLCKLTFPFNLTAATIKYNIQKRYIRHIHINESSSQLNKKQNLPTKPSTVKPSSKYQYLTKPQCLHPQNPNSKHNHTNANHNSSTPQTHIPNPGDPILQ